MTSDQIYVLRKSFARVEKHAHVAALVFYQRLFELDPSLRPMFKTDIEVQSRKLLAMLGLALSLTEHPALLKAELRELGARHRGYGVRDHHFETLRQALLDMLQAVLGADFTATVHEAWTEFYSFMTKTMQENSKSQHATLREIPNSNIQ